MRIIIAIELAIIMIGLGLEYISLVLGIWLGNVSDVVAYIGLGLGGLLIIGGFIALAISVTREEESQDSPDDKSPLISDA